MKKILFRYFIPFLTVMSLSACNKEYDGSEDLSYMWFDVSGKVVNEAGEPVPEISVYAESAEVVKTDAAGAFSVRGGGLPATTTAIRCIDTDKEQNGRYMTKTAIVELEKYKKGQGWVEGYYRNSKEVVIVLTEEYDITPVDSADGSGQEEGQ